MDSEQNGSLHVTDVIDMEDTRTLESQRLIDPSATPENLREYAFGVGCPCPTRTMTRETAIALRALQYPMFGNPIHYSPDSMEVGEARNHIVEKALKDGVEWLFFLDYDVAPPPNALIKMLKLNKPIVAGVYHSKSVPSWPLIMVKGWPYAFEDYEIGDLIKADGFGMGCTLINMEVFKKIDPPWFKTVPGYSKNSSAILPQLTEDIYFCDKAKKAGFDLIVDTSIQCQHVDWKTGLLYHLVPDPNNPKKGIPGWSYRRGEHYVSEFLPNADHPGRNWAKTDPPKASKKKIDLGCGSTPKKGFIGIDLYPTRDDVLQGDITDMSWYLKEYGTVSHVYSSHALEHISHRNTAMTFRSWVNLLSPDGTIEIHVPDGEFHMRRALELIDDKRELDGAMDWIIATIYGYQVGEGQEHKTLFTESRLISLADSCGLSDIKVERTVVTPEQNSVHQKPWHTETASLCLTAKRGK